MSQFYIYLRKSLGGWWYLGSSIDTYIGGGAAVLFTGTFAYITDITPEETRTGRIALINVFFLSGPPIGIMIGGLINEPLGYVGVFIVAGVIALICLLYVVSTCSSFFYFSL